MTDLGQIAAHRLAQLASCSEAGDGVTRLPFTEQHEQALTLLRQWMARAGMAVHLDAAGTLVGRIEGGPRTFYLGSHQDSVRHGGAYDGIMGIVLPLLALESLGEQGIRLPFSVELLAFADEEGVRFPTALVGSRAIAGTVDPQVLDGCDAQGLPMRQVMERFGLRPEKIADIARDPAQAIGFLETHIEQGPVLEQAGEALGVVTAICGIERHSIRFEGETGHAGTVPMDARRDALVAAAELVGFVNRLGRSNDGLRATVGALSVRPNVVNAIPKLVEMTAEFRSPSDRTRQEAGRALQAEVQNIAKRHGVTASAERTYAQSAQSCDPDMSAAMVQAIRSTGGQGLCLPSGATHDASAMAALCPVAMLFVRCRDGVSHTPAEFCKAEDMARAVQAIVGFLKALGP